MPESVIANTSPLFYLHRLGLLEILPPKLPGDWGAFASDRRKLVYRFVVQQGIDDRNACLPHAKSGAECSLEYSDDPIVFQYPYPYI
jgi:hypothetical protein